MSVSCVRLLMLTGEKRKEKQLCSWSFSWSPLLPADGSVSMTAAALSLFLSLTHQSSQSHVVHHDFCGSGWVRVVD